MTEMLLHLSADINDFSCCGDYEEETSIINQMLLWFEKQVLIISVCIKNMHCIYTHVDKKLLQIELIFEQRGEEVHRATSECCK